MNLPETIKAIQRACGCESIDGVFGPETAAKVQRKLQHDSTPADVQELTDLPDERSLEAIHTLDCKAVPMFAEFWRLANATAATFGCSYIAIDGNRTWAEQDALYAKGRTAPGSIVTKAKGGQSNHNFGIALDFGVFKGKVYMDGGGGFQQEIASKVHKACSMHAEACGLEWGGNWKSIVDQPHYEVATGLSLPEKSKLFRQKGSVL